MKRVVAVIIAVIAAVAVWKYLQKGTPSPPAQTTRFSSSDSSQSHRVTAPPGAGNPAQSAGANPSSAAQSQMAALQSASVKPPALPQTPLPYQLGSADKVPDMEPATVLSNMRIAINSYSARFGENPVGTNPEITAALNGQNEKQVKFIKDEAGLRINGNGELVDYWGTPFFFHQLSGTQMEIHSAGPDRKMWTADDLVTR